MMLVTIMPGPGDQFRVRELAPNCTRPMTMKWTGNYDNAVEYVRDNYCEEDVLAPCDFRTEVLARRKANHDSHV
jgi:hypothetical protein